MFSKIRNSFLPTEACSSGHPAAIWREGDDGDGDGWRGVGAIAFLPRLSDEEIASAQNHGMKSIPSYGAIALGADGRVAVAVPSAERIFLECFNEFLRAPRGLFFCIFIIFKTVKSAKFCV